MGCLHRRLCLGGARALPFVRKFKPKEIETATNGFSTVVETGPRGTAYRARFTDGLVATVRRASDRDQEKDAFYQEQQLLGRLNHRHIVRLHGFSEGHNRFLVFDHMENRSLKECLHGLQISDKKSSEQRRMDLVFQYGVLILELVTGQSPGGEGELVQWVQEPGFACSMHRMVDVDLGNTYDSKELRNLVIIARLCTSPGNDAMISIPQILRYLQGKVARLGCETRCE